MFFRTYWGAISSYFTTFPEVRKGRGEEGGNVQKITKLSFFQISQEITLWKSCTTFKKFLIVNKIKIKTKKLRN